MDDSITERDVRQQLAAMGSARFDLGALSRNGRMMLSEDCGAALIPSAIKWLRQENTHGAHIFIRPHGPHALSLVDDLSAEAIATMKRDGFAPAVIVETSVRNFQVWLKHGRILDCETSTFAAKELAKQFGGDPSSADWRHFGRLAGFTNQKLKRRLPNGLPPFVKLHECSGDIYRAASKFLEEIAALVRQRQERADARSSNTRGWSNAAVKPLLAFHNDRRYGGDLHRADMAWALHAAIRGVPEGQIREEILHGRDLSKKGRLARQLDYAERTTLKALGRLWQGN
ncbi:MAG: DNA-primase RepB domain-containing protein [Candidatus Binataceae bacterium]